jgi:hypothetical protein
MYIEQLITLITQIVSYYRFLSTDPGWQRNCDYIHTYKCVYVVVAYIGSCQHLAAGESETTLDQAGGQCYKINPSSWKSTSETMPTESNSLLAVHFCSNTFLFDENKLFPGSAQFSRFSIDLYINHASLLFVQQPLQIAMFNFVRFVSQQLSHKSESFYIVGRTNALEQNSYPPLSVGISINNRSRKIGEEKKSDDVTDPFRPFSAFQTNPNFLSQCRFAKVFVNGGSMLWSHFSAIFANFRRKIGVFLINQCCDHISAKNSM